MIIPAPKLSWLRLTPDRSVFGLPTVEGLLLLFEWFWLVRLQRSDLCRVDCSSGRRRSHVIDARLARRRPVFRWKFHYAFHLLLLLTVAIAVACSWVAIEIQQERK
jgi:hypothetical protein